MLNKKLKIPPIDYTSANISLVNGCNSRCIKCSIWHNKKTIMGETLYLKILQQLKKVGVKRICLSGGETTIIKNYKWYIEKAIKNGFHTMLISNCLNLSPNDIKDFVTIGLNSLMISLDGGTAKSHDAIVGVPGAWQHIMDLLDSCDYLIGANNFNIEFNTVVCAININDVINIPKIAYEHSVKSVNFSRLYTGYEKNKKDQLLIKDNEVFLKTLALLQEETLFYELETDIGKNKKHIPKTYCHYPFNVTTIDVDGSLYVCCRLRRDKSAYLGNCAKRNIKDIISDKNTRDILAGYIKPFKNKECIYCHKLLKNSFYE